MRRDYLREHCPASWAALVNSGKLTDHLKEIEQAARQRMDTIMPQLMKVAGVTEELKARDQLAWVGLVNNCQARVDEIILAELVYVKGGWSDADF